MLRFAGRGGECVCQSCPLRIPERLGLEGSLGLEAVLARTKRVHLPTKTFRYMDVYMCGHMWTISVYIYIYICIIRVEERWVWGTYAYVREILVVVGA